MESASAEPRVEEYLRLLAEHERGLAAYVHSLVPGSGDAEDILQECRVPLWREFSKFEAGTNFLAWARKIALHQILNFRRSQKRRPLFCGRPSVHRIGRRGDRSTLRRPGAPRRSLRHCLRKLPKPHLQAIAWRYYEACPIEEIASKTKRSEGAVDRLLSRIRQALNDCVTRTIASPLS